MRRVLRYSVPAAVLTAIVVSVSYLTSLFAQQGVPDEPRPAAVSPDEMQPIPDDAAEVQTSGPVHEAFANPPTVDAPESFVVRKRPPETIEELPPEQKPDGANVVWIPGYFAWDDDREDYLWMSGFWRDVPPGRVWVSGYWTQADNGWQWVPGFFTSAEQREVEYLPQPPETIEEGPSIAQPSVNHFWVPGHWHWAGDHYDWRAGYWSRVNPDWVWSPAHYVWCPSGYVFVNGFWDYPPIRRGLLFAPVYFRPNVYHRHYYYTPSIVWSTAHFTSHLWVRPSYYHYYYGDFYDDHYHARGIRPWYLSFSFGRTSYDPLYSYYRWYHRDRGDWASETRGRYDYYRRNRDARPPRTYRDQQQIVARGGNRDRLRDAVVAAPITQVVNRTTVNNVTANIIDSNFGTSLRFDRVPQQERRQIARQADEMRQVVRQRQQLETRENIARVEDGDRKGARKGEDARKRTAAPRTLDISKAAQAIGATSSQDGTGGKGRRLRDGQPGVDGRPRAGDISGRGGPDITRPGRNGDVKGAERAPDLTGRGSGKDEKTVERGSGARGRGRGADVPGIDRVPDVKGTDRGPDLTGKDAVPRVKGKDIEPDVRGKDRTPDARGRDRLPDVKEADRLRDRTPSITGPDLIPDAGKGRGDSGKGRDTGKSRGDAGKGRGNRESGARPSVTVPPTGLPDAGRTDIPVPRRDSGDSGSAKSKAADGGKSGSSGRTRGSGTDRSPTVDRAPSREGGSVERGRGRPDGASTDIRRGSLNPNPSQRAGMGIPQATPREPSPIAVDPARSGMTRSPRAAPDPSSATRQAPSRIDRPDPVTPLRLGAPTPARAAPSPSPRVPAATPSVTRGSGRSSPGASSAAPSTGSGARDSAKKRLRDRD